MSAEGPLATQEDVDLSNAMADAASAAYDSEQRLRELALQALTRGWSDRRVALATGLHRRTVKLMRERAGL